MYDKILFVDFDGTITSEETFETTMRRYTPPALFAEKMKDVMTGKIPLNEGVHMAFDMIPCSKMPEIMEYVRSVPVRPGFREMLETAKAKGIPVVVMSGGLKPYIVDKLEPYMDLITDLYAVDTDLSGETIQLHSDFEGGGETMNKALVMKTYDYKTGMCIGDSIADMSMVKASQVVFARDSLCDICDKYGIPYTKWETFFDIQKALEEE